MLLDHPDGAPWRGDAAATTLAASYLGWRLGVAVSGP